MDQTTLEFKPTLDTSPIKQTVEQGAVELKQRADDLSRAARAGLTRARRAIFERAAQIRARIPSKDSAISAAQQKADKHFNDIQLELTAANKEFDVEDQIGGAGQVLSPATSDENGQIDLTDGPVSNLTEKDTVGLNDNSDTNRQEGKSERPIEAGPREPQLLEIHKEMQRLSKDFGVGVPTTVYDPDTGEPLTEESLRKAQSQLVVMQLQARRAAEELMTKNGIGVPKYDGETGEPLINLGIDKQLEVYKRKLEREARSLLTDLENRGKFIPKFNLQTRQRFVNGSLAQLQLAEKGLTREEYEIHQELVFQEGVLENPPITMGTTFSREEGQAQVIEGTLSSKR